MRWTLAIAMRERDCVSDSDLQQRRDDTRRCNEDVLASAGFRRVSNSALFRNSAGVDILSPGVDRNSTGTFWFDVRAVNLARVQNLGSSLVAGSDRPVLVCASLAARVSIAALG